MPIEVSSTDAPSLADTYRGVLHELVELGAGLARRVCRELEQADASAVAEATVAFERVSRSVRKCILLVRVLDAPVRAPQGSARRRIIRAVEDRIQACREGAEAESLRAELAERLDGPELVDEIGDRPVAAVIEDICRDLGIAAPPGTRPWARRRPEDVAVLHRLAAGLGRSGLAAHPALRSGSAGDAAHPQGPAGLHHGRFRGK